ncbi:MAG: oligopeptide transporter, OPT family [Deltaproteobacteria bacterium]|jgi:putative OPT family oligopeptide transporter|nr:oligopeptide transporter, OPT family [Deltaproteobacteria bacterium]
MTIPDPSNQFKPYISPETQTPELTFFSICFGIVLAIISVGANLYLALRVGLTVSTSIPAAVVSMAIIRIVLKRESILENNIVQTTASSGESLAAGAIFTIPAFFYWYIQFGMGTPSYILITLIVISGGILGVLIMVLLRKKTIVEEHGALPFPEAVACSRVLLAGEGDSKKAMTTLIGFAISGIYKFVADGLKLFPSNFTLKIPGLKGAAFGMDLLPGLLGIGYIIGIRISIFLLSGALLGWLVIMPLLCHFENSIQSFFPGSVPIAELDSFGLWNNYIRFIGSGMIIFCAISTILKTLPDLIKSLRSFLTYILDRKTTKPIETDKNIPRTEKGIPIKISLIAIVTIILIIGLTPIFPTGLLGALLIAFFGILFSLVTARIVGVVGATNSPVSGLTIACLIVTAFLFKLTGESGPGPIIAIMVVGAVVCCVLGVLGDTVQDLKTGFILGATPRNQQIAEIIGVLTSGTLVGVFAIILNTAWGFGSSEIPAPQAALMKITVDGIMGGNFPKNLVIIGFGLGLFFSLFRFPVIPMAIGLYLPIHIASPIFAGGFIQYLFDKQTKKDKVPENIVFHQNEKGVLFSSGLVAGEGIVGILLAFFAFLKINLALTNEPLLGNVFSCLSFAFLIYYLRKKVFSYKNS